MDIGVALPTMAAGYSREVHHSWCAGIDAGPFSSISCGERITYRNPEMMTTLASAASLTERVRVFVNLVVAPMHPPALVAKELATLEMLSDGRVTLGVGVGGREHDYRAMDSSYERRHSRLDIAVAEIRSILAGSGPFEGSDPVGPEVVGGRDMEILAGAMGPKGLGRAARWADGVSGFSLTADGTEIAEAAEAARRAWSIAGRDEAPRLVTGCFYVLGVDEPQETLRQFTYDYLEIFGKGAARTLSEGAPVWNTERLATVLGEAAEAGIDEFILVPGTVDPACLAATTSFCVSSLAP
ncbi:MAG: LLM class flavin-dependent oxidoreductase [Microthrixaceae bacterium]|nr:LLM class flavin-dependent oxidoreductase [Microthrixaceae bacterium]